MKTSRFANIQRIKVPLSISLYPPKWYAGPQFKDLAPPWKLIEGAHKGMSKEMYTREFHELVLAKLDPRAVYDDLVAQHGDEVTLLCFENLEKPGEYCHRRIVAEWFQDNLQIMVPELEPVPTIRSTLSW